MKVSFRKDGKRRYSVHVQRDRAPDLWCDSLAQQWSKLQVGASLTLERPRPGRRRKHPARDKRRPAAARRR
jgi:hypothetical protein